MLCGVWMAWPWFVINAWALGSPTRRREAALPIAGIFGALVLVVVIVFLERSGSVPAWAVPYLLMLITGFKLGIGYWIYLLQARTFGVWEFYGGTVNRFLPMLIFVGLRMRESVLEGLSGAWILVLM
jgi:hypothetical protein